MKNQNTVDITGIEVSGLNRQREPPTIMILQGMRKKRRTVAAELRNKGDKKAEATGKWDISMREMIAICASTNS